MSVKQERPDMFLWDVLGAMSLSALIDRFMGPTWDPPGADRTQVGPMLAPWTLAIWELTHTEVVFSYR